MRKLILTLLVSFGLVLVATAQNRTVSGTLKDEKGNPVVNGSVIVKGSNAGTTTNSTGGFSINVPDNARTLVLSGVGFTPQEISIGNKTTINVVMQSSSVNIEEVVITGYTTEKRKNYTGAATVLSSKTVENVPVASFDQALQGRAPGILANSGSGQPGGSANVIIRGFASIGGQVQPLYIVDGVQLSAADLAMINPNDFESINVLKDGTAGALYGSRGSLGVIVITTKRGKAGKTNFTFRNQYGFTQRPQPSQFDQFNSKQMLAYEEFVGAYTNIVAPGWTYSANNPANASLPATSPAGTPYAASKARYAFLLDSLGNNNVDYYDILFRTGVSRTTDLSMSGGAAGTRYFLSFNNFSQEGTDRKSKLDRYSVRANLDFTSGKFSSQLSTTIGYVKTIYNEGTFYAGNGTANPFAMAWRAKPYENPYGGPNGSLLFGATNALNPKAIGNLIERSDNSTWNENQIKFNGGWNAAYKIMPYLTLSNQLGADAGSINTQGYINPNSLAGQGQTYGLLYPGFLNETFFNRLLVSNATGLVFSKRIATRHSLDVGAYWEVIRQWNKGFAMSLWNLDPRLSQSGQGAGQIPVTPVGATTVPQNGNSAKSGYGIRSYFGTLRYTFDNKYTFAANVRRDGTSRIIASDNKEITTYSVGLNWDATKEAFFDRQKVLTDLRVRASYGRNFNVNSVPTQSFALGSTFGYTAANYLGPQVPAYSAVGFPGSSITASAPTSPYNPSLRLEYIDKTNIGFELGFLNNRIRLTTDFYRNITKDMFVNQVLPATSGFPNTSSLAINAGSMENKGVDFDLNIDIVKTKDIDVSVRANHSINKNKILDLGTVTEYTAGTFLIKEGLPYGSHYTFDYLGADPATGKPVYRKTDGTLTTNIAEAQQKAEFGTYLPVHTGGFAATVRFKQFTLDAFFSYQFDVERSNNVRNWVAQGDATYTGAVNQSQILLNQQWHQPGDVKFFQGPNSSRQFTSADIMDASFLRFRNLNIAYLFTPQKTSVIKSARFYVQGQNIAIWSPWSGLDPEDNNNISLAEFPNPKALVVGLDINF